MPMVADQCFLPDASTQMPSLRCLFPDASPHMPPHRCFLQENTKCLGSRAGVITIPWIVHFGSESSVRASDLLLIMASPAQKKSRDARANLASESSLFLAVALRGLREQAESKLELSPATKLEASPALETIPADQQLCSSPVAPCV